MEKRSTPAVLDFLAEIRRYVKESADRAGIEAARTYQLQLAVDEIATNIILHGYKDADASAVISIGSEMSGDALIIMLEDQAPAFDPNTMELPEAEGSCQASGGATHGRPGDLPRLPGGGPLRLPP